LAGVVLVVFWIFQRVNLSESNNILLTLWEIVEIVVQGKTLHPFMPES
jgi:hypothetical protein